MLDENFRQYLERELFSGIVSIQNKCIIRQTKNGTRSQIPIPLRYKRFYKAFSTTASRVVGILKENRILKDEEVVCHKNECNNELCINPEHVYIGTDKTNSRDYWNTKEGMKRKHCKTVTVITEEVIEGLDFSDI